MIFKKEKEEIKNLINTLEYCHIYLALEMTHDATNRIVVGIEEIEELLSKTRQRLRELGVY